MTTLTANEEGLIVHVQDDHGPTNPYRAMRDGLRAYLAALEQEEAATQGKITRLHAALDAEVQLVVRLLKQKEAVELLIQESAGWQPTTHPPAPVPTALPTTPYEPSRTAQRTNNSRNTRPYTQRPFGPLTVRILEYYATLEQGQGASLRTARHSLLHVPPTTETRTPPQLAFYDSVKSLVEAGYLRQQDTRGGWSAYYFATERARKEVTTRGTATAS